jgi:molybdenum cofactor guanylyltransferase
LKSAIILAGGKSERMGKNKAIVDIMGKPLLSWSVDSLSKLVDDLVIVSRNDNDAKLYEKILSERVRIVIDDSVLEGPLVGIISGFKVVKSDYCYVHPVDSPVIKKEVIEYLFGKAQNFDGAVWKINDETIEPLHAVYRVNSVLKISERVLKTGNTSAKILSKEIQIKYLGLDELRSMDKNTVSLFNINTPSDIQFIENYLKNQRLNH